MKVSVVNLDKKNAGTIDVPNKFFGSKWNPDLTHQAVLTQQANSRNIIAHTKGRGEVSGGGKKPWKQKGTGRARHGSIRSPIWKGGGVTFGPSKERIFAKKINKKMKITALFSSISKKFSDNEVFVVSFPVTAFQIAKTKNFIDMTKNIMDGYKKALFVMADSKKKTRFLMRNSKNIKSISPKSLNVVDVLKNHLIVFDSDSIDQLVKHFGLSK